MLGYKRLRSLEVVIKDDKKCEREKKNGDYVGQGNDMGSNGYASLNLTYRRPTFTFLFKVPFIYFIENFLHGTVLCDLCLIKI